LDEKGGVLPDDINYVVCTHGHSDHVGNLNLFPDATFIVSYDVSKKDEYTVHRFEDGLPYKIDDGENVNYNFHNYASLGTSMGVPGGGGGDKQSQSGKIRFIVGQYWLIIKINGTNSVNFVGNYVNFVKFLRKIFFDNAGTIRKSRANFFPPP
jgi:hypothetical protein